MKKKFLYTFSIVALLSGGGCNKKDLDVQNPNTPTPASAASEAGLTALSLGAVYVNGI
jgi:hypothetical protein